MNRFFVVTLLCLVAGGQGSPASKTNLMDQLKRALQEKRQSPVDVGAKVEDGWKIVDEMYRVSMALDLINNPLDGSTPGEAAGKLLDEMFGFDKLAENVFRQLIHKYAKNMYEDHCSELLHSLKNGPVRKKRGVEMPTPPDMEELADCFSNRLGYFLSLVEHLDLAEDVEEHHAIDVAEMFIAQHDLIEFSYHIFQVLKERDPSLEVPDFLLNHYLKVQPHLSGPPSPGGLGTDRRGLEKSNKFVNALASKLKSLLEKRR